MAGAGVYTYQLVRALAGLEDAPRLVVFARPGVFDDLPVRVVPIEPANRPARLVWEQLSLPLLLRRLAIKVLHSPHHHTPLLAGAARHLRRVVTLHDLTFLLLPERYPLTRRLYMEGVTRAAARVADAIITPSRTVRRDVIERLSLPPERIVAVPEAPAPQFVPIDDEDTLGRLRWKHRLPNRYILSVGSREPGKNRARLISAYARLRTEGVEAPLVIAGQPAWHHEGEEALVCRLGLDEHVRFLGYVPDEELPALYNAATLLAFPSLYEGFGLPVLEAMACGTPVVTSDVSATAEIAGDAALLVNPLDTRALAAAIGSVLSSDTLRAELRERGLARAKQFSWERTARETLSIYHVVAAT